MASLTGRLPAGIIPRPRPLVRALCAQHRCIGTLWHTMAHTTTCSSLGQITVTGANKPLQTCMAQDKTPSEQDGSATLQATSLLLATTQSVGSTRKLREENSALQSPHADKRSCD
jgi:hypothetical protein